MFDCRLQIGLCPNGCNQCFYNRKDAYYQDINQSSVPCPKDVGDGIVRMNCGHDSNIERDLVIETSKLYKHAFFNTSIPNLNFPGPVVLTANPNEEKEAVIPFSFVEETPGRAVFKYKEFENLMFVRLRVSATNLTHIEKAVDCWTRKQVPVVLTFMAYYDEAPPGTVSANLIEDPLCYVLEDRSNFNTAAYRWQKRHINSYYCATEGFMEFVTARMKRIGGRLVTRCGTAGSRYCKDCKMCELSYWLTRKHLQESKLNWDR